MTQNETRTPAGVALVGYGTAGVNAAIALRTSGYKGTITAFSDTAIPPYSPILTSYYAGGEKTYEQCFPWSADELAALDVDLLQETPVTFLDPAEHLLRTPKGDFTYDKCVICSGARAMSFGFPQVEGYKQLVLRTMDDAERLKAAIESPSCKRVLVSGASMIALKMLEACLNHDLDCELVGMNPHILDFNALPEAAERFERGLRAQGVALRFGETIKAVEICDPAPADGRLQVTFSSGDVRNYDEILVAHGVRSDLSYLAEGSIEMDRGILVDERMRTSNPDVFAAGDVVQALELISGEKRIVGIWKTAALQGACAGRAIAADLAGTPLAARDVYGGGIPMNTIGVKGTLFISAGTMEVTDNRYVEVREDEDLTVIYIFENMPDAKRRLVGFNLVCDTDEAGSKAYDTGAMLTLRIEAGCR